MRDKNHRFNVGLGCKKIFKEGDGVGNRGVDTCSKRAHIGNIKNRILQKT